MNIKLRHILPLLVIALTMLAIGVHSVVEVRKVANRLASDSDSRALSVSRVSLRDANGHEINDAQTEAFNGLLSKINKRNEMRLSVAKYESMAGPWVLLGGLLMAYSLFLLSKLQTAKPPDSGREL
jgi:hypothetical protein